jgi:hypothetical protein
MVYKRCDKCDVRLKSDDVHRILSYDFCNRCCVNCNLDMEWLENAIERGKLTVGLNDGLVN